MGRKVEIMCVGAQKAGTSSLHDILKNHPNIELPFVKELYYFINDKEYRNVKNLHKHYHFHHHKVAMNITPGNMAHPEAMRRIFEYNPAMKIIVILRDPTDRFVSHYRMIERNLVEKAPFIEVYQNDLKAYQENRLLWNRPLGRSLYNEQIKRIQSIFPKQQIYYILFEDFINDQQKVVNELLAWCGLPGYNFNSVISNIAFNPKKTFFWKAYRSIPRSLLVYLTRLVRSDVISRLKAFFSEPIELTTIDENAVIELRRFFMDFVDETEELTGLNCESWRKKYKASNSI